MRVRTESGTATLGKRERRRKRTDRRKRENESHRPKRKKKKIKRTRNIEKYCMKREGQKLLPGGNKP